MESYFVLNERGEPQIEHDVDAWMRWFEQADRNLARTSISADIMVLTTFRGVDEAHQPGQLPRLFETRVFGGVLDGEELDFETRDDALTAHADLVEWCRLGTDPNYGLDERMLR